MTMTRRVLRSHSRNELVGVPEPPTRYQLKQDLARSIQPLTGRLTSKLTGLSKQDLATLNLKRSKLQSPPSRTLEFIADFPHDSSSTALASAARSTLVFAQHEAGTAVCISASGLVLTCSHCVAESQEESAESEHWLIFSSGRVVQTKCVAWDARRDLALLQIVAAEEVENGSPVTFPFATIARKALAAPRTKQTPLICIGHPGSEDLEAVTTSAPVPTNYDVLHVSYGHYLGMAVGQDVHDNSDIGALKHDCWTYWGHSGAPLIATESGEVVGLHSSWDDQTGIRRGIGWDAVDGFLTEWCMRI
jgi:S1-C subfamily serine protease